MQKYAPISVVIPCYCCSELINRAVESVFNQTLLPKEIILIDDASPDSGKTKESIESILSKYHSNKNINIIAKFLEKNIGPGAARNKGLDLSAEKYVAFLDADDYWLTNKIEIQFNWLNKNKNILLSCHDSMHEANRKYFQSAVIFNETKLNRNFLILKNIIITSSVMMVNNKNWRFPSNMKYAEDYFLWLNMLFRGEKLVKLNLVLGCSNRTNHYSLSKNLYEMHVGIIKCYEFLRDEKFINYFQFYFFLYIEKIKFLKRKIFNKCFHFM